MSLNVTVMWMDSGSSQGKIDSINQKFILEEGTLNDGQDLLTVIQCAFLQYEFSHLCVQMS